MSPTTFTNSAAAPGLASTRPNMGCALAFSARSVIYFEPLKLRLEHPECQRNRACGRANSPVAAVLFAASPRAARAHFGVGQFDLPVVSHRRPRRSPDSAHLDQGPTTPRRRRPGAGRAVAAAAPSRDARAEAGAVRAG